MNVDNPRKIAKNALVESLGKAQWLENSLKVDKVKEAIKNHPINNHPIIPLLSEGGCGKEDLFYIHLEYRKAIVQAFTDALVMLQYQAKTLESDFEPGIKAIPRFLITLNTLDEFGFRPGFDSNEYYQGNPLLAHYPLFEDVLKDFDIEQSADYTVSALASKLEDFLVNSFDDYILIAGLLAVAENIVCLFSPPLKANTETHDIETANGYYFFHGTSEDTEIEANDDDHEDDLWALIIHAVNEENLPNLLNKCVEYCDLWQEFWDYQMKQVS